jgi:hypothetical protein
MRRILGGMVFLLILVAVSGGCQDRRKDEIPPRTEPLPKVQQQPVNDRNSF